MTHLSRTVLYCGVSTLMTAAVILSVAEARPNFFAVAMYLSQSSACLLVLTNMFVVFTLITGKLLQRIFFGRLRAIEVDHLYERAWYAVTESCLAMTIFREEFGTSFFLFFTLLLSVKIFHWLTQDRIEYMEQTIQVPRSFHVRLTSIMAILLAVDCYMVAYCLEQVFTHGPNVMIMFAFEFTILASSILAVVGKYILNLIEARQTETWDNKSGYVFYLELVSDFIKLVTYIAFFATLMTFYGIPLHILRDLYVTFRSFTTKCRNFMRFRRATQDMDARYKNATVAEIDATGDKTCIVCREEMYHESQPQPEGEPPRTIFDNPKKLPCGHILHFRCLRSWLERQQTCPMCRRSVLDDPVPTTSRTNDPQRGAAEPANPAVERAHQAPPNTSAPGTGIHANNASFQMPNATGVDPVQLPRGFRLPPGWALLPVSTANNVPTPGPAEASPLVSEHNRSETSSNPQSTQSTQRNSSVTVPRLPPIIPFFNLNGADGHQIVTLPPELTDEQVTAMEQSTRRTVEERLRILSEIQSRISEGFSMLSRLQNIPLPDEPMPPNMDAADTSNVTSVEPSIATTNDDQVIHSPVQAPDMDTNEPSNPLVDEVATNPLAQED